MRFLMTFLLMTGIGYGKVNEHNGLVPRDHWIEGWGGCCVAVPMAEMRNLVSGSMAVVWR